MKLCRIDFNVDDTQGSIRALLERLGLRPIADPFGDSIELDLGKCGFVGPSAVVTLVGLRRLALGLGHELRLGAMPELERLANYCRYSGLAAEFSAGPAPTDHPDNVTTRVREFQESVPASEIAEVVSLAKGQMNLSAVAEDDLSLVLTELTQNVLDHSGSSVGGFISARAYGKEREVRMAVGDMGIGIRASLSPRVQARDDGHAIRQALQEEVSGRTSPRNLGLGLSHLHAIVRQAKGRIVICSRQGYLVFENGRDRVGTTEVTYPGTLVFVRLPARPEDDRAAEVSDVWS